MKILFMGTPEPAAKCLNALIAAKEGIIAVITQPDRPKGRGLKVSGTPVKDVALHYNIPVHQPPKIKDLAAIDLIRKIAPDLIVVVAYGKILPRQILDIPKFGTINVHASLLPKYRGAAPVQWAIMNGEKETGITIMKVTEQLDSGDIILQRKIKIDEMDDTRSLTVKLFDIGADLLLESIALIKKGEASYIKQDDKLATLAPQLIKESGIIDWKKGAKQIYDQIKACYPWPVAYTFLHGKMFRIFSAEVGFAEKEQNPGMVADLAKDGGFMVDAGSGTIFVKEVQLESGKKMHAWDFVIGHKLKKGDVFPS